MELFGNSHIITNPLGLSGVGTVSINIIVSPHTQEGCGSSHIPRRGVALPTYPGGVALIKNGLLPLPVGILHAE